MNHYLGDFNFAKVWLQRLIASVYLIAFISAYCQFPALLGDHGLLPVRDFMKFVPFGSSPSLFYFFYSDRFFNLAAGTGIFLSLVMCFGFLEKKPWWVLTASWLLIWVLYLSIVNVGQTFYAFGWESMLLEAGFFAAFLGPKNQPASWIPVLALRWMFFRLMMGAGWIKWRNDACWRDLTCLFFHYETQPIPGPLSWYFHHLPKFLLRAGGAFNHAAEMAVPFGLLGPQWVAAIASLLIIFHQGILILSGNFAWLNLLTMVLGVSAFSDSVIRKFFPSAGVSQQDFLARSKIHNAILKILMLATLVLSIPPALNLCSPYQRMNYDYNPLHLINDYGMFGTITRERYEIVVEGTQDTALTPETKWTEYEFKGKPGEVRRRPPQIAPYHLRLDWLMWFLPFSVSVTQSGITVPGYEVWFLRFMRKLLEGDRSTLSLLRGDPFPGKSPHYVRAEYYLYQFTDGKEKRETGAWWKRKKIADYLPPVTRDDLKGV